MSGAPDESTLSDALRLDSAVSGQIAIDAHSDTPVERENDRVEAGGKNSGTSEGNSAENEQQQSESHTPKKQGAAWRRYCSETGGPITVKLESEGSSSSSESSDYSGDESSAEEKSRDKHESSSEEEEQSYDKGHQDAYKISEATPSPNESAGVSQIDNAEEKLLRTLCLDYGPKNELGNGGDDDEEEASLVVVTPWHTYGCGRGEIRLSEEELGGVTQYLQKRGADRWRITPVPETVPTRHHGGAKAAKHKRAAQTSDHRGRNVKRNSVESDSASSPVSNRRSPHGGAAYGHSSEQWLTRRSTRVSQPFGENLKKAPDWVRRFHRIISNVCQHEDYQDIATELSERMSQEAAATAANSMSIIQPLGLNSVLTNLEANDYDTPLEVFNDLYSIWVGAFRRLPPGGVAWTRAHVAAGHFLRLVSSEPLKGDFNPPNSPYDPAAAQSSRGRTPDVNKFFRQITGRSTATAPSQTNSWRRKRPSSSSLENCSKAPSRSNGRSNLPRTSGGGRGKAPNQKKKMPKDLDAPITPAEREYFQSLLSQLQQEHHPALYTQFQTTAVWKQAEDDENNDVDLDDKNTPPRVLRKMIGWCRHVLGHSAHPGARQKSAVSASSVSSMKQLSTDVAAVPYGQQEGCEAAFQEAVSSSSSSNSSSSSHSESSDLEGSPSHDGSSALKQIL